MFDNLKEFINTLIGIGLVKKDASISLVNCEGKFWSYVKDSGEIQGNLKVVNTEEGLDLLEMASVLLYRMPNELVIGVQILSKKEYVFYILESSDEYSTKE